MTVTETLLAGQMQKYAGKGVFNRYRLLNDTYATTVGPDGHAKNEGWLDAGTIVRLRGMADDMNPWTGAAQGNRPSGQVPVEVEGSPGCELIPRDTEVELVTAGELFLVAWEAAGKPPVEKIHYPSSGNSTVTILFSRNDVRAYCGDGDMKFSDDGQFVELKWQHQSAIFGVASATCKLMFDREAPINTRR